LIKEKIILFCFGFVRKFVLVVGRAFGGSESF
jgi:hypothetical protein